MSTRPAPHGPRAPRATFALLALLALAASASGCQRRTQLVPASADSTHASVDSFSVYAREAADRWEAGVGDEAATLSAKLVREALVLRPNGPWAERTRGVLDSLGIAAEVAGANTAIVANLFSRTDPDGDSWPFLFWRETNACRFQPIEGRGLHLADVSTMGFADDSTPTDSAEAAVLWGRRVGGGQQPQVTVWKYVAGGRWDLLQTLGADSLGGIGSGEFVTTDSTHELSVRTYRPTPFFDECATCPHVFHERRFVWRRTGFARIESHVVPSPYSTFTGFIAALAANDFERANTFVVDRSLIDFARRFDWDEPAKGRWRMAPATDEGSMDMVFLRGSQDAFRVRFEARDGDWVIAGFEPTNRSLE